MGWLEALGAIPTNANLRIKLAELEKDNAALKSEIATLKTQLDEKEKEIKILTDRINTMKANRPRMAEGTVYNPLDPGNKDGWLGR
jgi:septal ring factor EnvC (AmiA/AmiB activator)